MGHAIHRFLPLHWGELLFRYCKRDSRKNVFWLCDLLPASSRTHDKSYCARLCYFVQVVLCYFGEFECLVVPCQIHFQAFCYRPI